VETKAHLCFLKKAGGAVGVYMEPRGRWTEKVWETTGLNELSMNLILMVPVTFVAALRYFAFYKQGQFKRQ
jgi:hypothetical protein